MKKKTKGAALKIESAKVYSMTCKGCGHAAKIHVPKEAWPAIWLETARRVRVKATEDALRAMGDAFGKLLREADEK